MHDMYVLSLEFEKLSIDFALRLCFLNKSFMRMSIQQSQFSLGLLGTHDQTIFPLRIMCSTKWQFSMHEQFSCKFYVQSLSKFRKLFGRVFQSHFEIPLNIEPSKYTKLFAIESRTSKTLLKTIPITSQIYTYKHPFISSHSLTSILLITNIFEDHA